MMSTRATTRPASLLQGPAASGEPGIQAAPAAPVCVTLRGDRPSARTTIRFELSATPRAALDVLDAGGRHVRRLWESRDVIGGRYEAIWDGRDERGAVVPSGLYFYRLRIGGGSGRSLVVEGERS